VSTKSYMICKQSRRIHSGGRRRHKPKAIICFTDIDEAREELARLNRYSTKFCLLIIDLADTKHYLIPDIDAEHCYNPTVRHTALVSEY